MKLVVAATGASGAIYLQRLLDRLGAAPAAAAAGMAHDIHLVLSAPARDVIAMELAPGGLVVPGGIHVHDSTDMAVPFVSGSAPFDAMVVVPCSMATLARIAVGAADNAILRAADVFLKERRKLILVPRETPWNLIHARNAVTALEAGAVLLPACPAFYGHPQTVAELADTVVCRILDHLGLPPPDASRWQTPPGR